MKAFFHIKIKSSTVALLSAFIIFSALALPALAAVSSLQLVACPLGASRSIETLSEHGESLGVKINALVPIQVFQSWGQNDRLNPSDATKLHLVRVHVSSATSMAGKNVYISANEALSTEQ